MTEKIEYSEIQEWAKALSFHTNIAGVFINAVFLKDPNAVETFIINTLTIGIMHKLDVKDRESLLSVIKTPTALFRAASKITPGVSVILNDVLSHLDVDEFPHISKKCTEMIFNIGRDYDFSLEENEEEPSSNASTEIDMDSDDWIMNQLKDIDFGGLS